MALKRTLKRDPLTPAVMGRFSMKRVRGSRGSDSLGGDTAELEEEDEDEDEEEEKEEEEEEECVESSFAIAFADGVKVVTDASDEDEVEDDDNEEEGWRVLELAVEDREDADEDAKDAADAASFE